MSSSFDTGAAAGLEPERVAGRYELIAVSPNRQLAIHEHKLTEAEVLAYTPTPLHLAR